jgi:hypothetical protein
MSFVRGQVVSVDYVPMGIHFLGIFLYSTENSYVIAYMIPLPTGRNPPVWVTRNPSHNMVSPCHDLRAVMAVALAYEEFLLSGRDFEW